MNYAKQFPRLKCVILVPFGAAIGTIFSRYHLRRKVVVLGYPQSPIHTSRVFLHIKRILEPFSTVAVLPV